LKPNPARAPFVKLGRNIFGDEDDLRRPADECVVFRVGLGCDQRKHGAAVGRSNRHPALTRSKADITDQTESKLVQVKSQTLILIANKDVNSVDAEMGWSLVYGRT
jgi:hypothetical protein